MDKGLETNAKSMQPEEQYRLRKDIVRMSKAGEKVNQIAKHLDVSESMVYKTIKKYNDFGIAGIKPKQKGPQNGVLRKLDDEKSRQIKRLITENNPDQLKFKCCMWTRKAVVELVWRDYKIDVPESTMGQYLREWGFSIQRPLLKAMKQDPQKVEKWLNEEYPAIEEKAKQEKAEIFWGDETAIQNTANYSRGYAPVGQTPVLEVESKKMKLNMLSAISNQGKLRFTISKESVNTDILIDFMRRLVNDSEKKVILILDNLRVHHAKKVQKWLGKHKDEIEVFYLPPYSPEYNPDEYLNNDFKRDISKRPMPRSEDDMEHNARSFMKTRQLNPGRIRSYFDHKSVTYAA